ncbi:MAG: AGE family epimerase/isomerase [Phycisphaerales bacterium]|nr:MAG: AGE family epimerase/isomerase [Phycisphaerales bacterium]
MKKHIAAIMIVTVSLLLNGACASGAGKTGAPSGDSLWDCRNIDDFAARVRKELDENILAFWLKHSLDTEHGGFIGRMSNDNTIQRNAPKGLVLNTRILWTFSAAYRFDKRPEYLKTAERAYDYLMEHFLDKEHGGAFWVLDNKGRPTDTSKELYGQSFVIYSLCEYFQATGSVAALKKAKELFRLIEKHCHDGANGGYYETFARDWSRAEKARLASGDAVEHKTMNTHLHLLEAYAGLYRVWKAPKVKRRLRELIEVFRDHIIDPQTYHFKLFFDAGWRSTKDVVSYGHDIEGSWLLSEAADVLGDEELIREIRPLAVKMARAVYDHGFDSDGGLFYEGERGRITNRSKQWWPQAETVVGFLNAYQINRQEHFLEAARRCWGFIENHLVDRKNGEWLSTAPMTGRADPAAMKISEWKAPYHNARACLETLKRLNELKD